jgi:hypothetical protein
VRSASNGVKQRGNGIGKMKMGWGGSSGYGKESALATLALSKFEGRQGRRGGFTQGVKFNLRHFRTIWSCVS